MRTADVFPEELLTGGRRLAIIDSSVDEVARPEADRKELQNRRAGFFDADRPVRDATRAGSPTAGPGFFCSAASAITATAMHIRTA